MQVITHKALRKSTNLIADGAEAHLGCEFLGFAGASGCERCFNESMLVGFALFIMIDHEAEFTFRVLLSVLEVVVEFELIALAWNGLPCFSDMLGVILGAILIVLSGNEEADLFTCGDIVCGQTIVLSGTSGEILAPGDGYWISGGLKGFPIENGDENQVVGLRRGHFLFLVERMLVICLNL